MSKSIGCLLAIGAVVLLAVLFGVGIYNGLVGAEQAVEAQWANVETAYQRRADLIPNLVETVKGSAAFERETLDAVVQARSRVGQISAQATSEILNDPQRFEQFQQAQEGLNSALGRLIAVAESYPDLKSTTAFRDLMVQLEGTENRINVERSRFNEVAQSYNTRVRRFPAALFAGMFGFEPKPYFRSQPGSETAPRVDFGTGASPAPR